MSTAALRATYHSDTRSIEPAGEGYRARQAGQGQAVRRRANLKQGYALEALGHAVEYLVDSRLFNQSEADARSDQEAIQVLMLMSRAVFAECAEVLPMRRRMSRWIAGGWRGSSAGKATGEAAAGR